MHIFTYIHVSMNTSGAASRNGISAHQAAIESVSALICSQAFIPVLALGVTCQLKTGVVPFTLLR